MATIIKRRSFSETAAPIQANSKGSGALVKAAIPKRNFSKVESDSNDKPLIKRYKRLGHNFGIAGPFSPGFREMNLESALDIASEAAPAVPSFIPFNVASNVSIQAQEDPRPRKLFGAAVKALPFGKAVKTMVEGGDVRDLESLTEPIDLKAPRKILTNVAKAVNPNYQEPENPVAQFGLDVAGGVLTGSPLAAAESLSMAARRIDAVRAAKTLKNLPERKTRLISKGIRTKLEEAPKQLPAPKNLGETFEILTPDEATARRIEQQKPVIKEMEERANQIAAQRNRVIPKRKPIALIEKSPIEIPFSGSRKEPQLGLRTSREITRGARSPRGRVLTQEGFARVGRSYAGMSEAELQAELSRLKGQTPKKVKVIPASQKVKQVSKIETYQQPIIKNPSTVVTRQVSSGEKIPIKSRSGITIPKEIVEGAENWKDLSKFEIQLLDQTRQIEKVAGPQAAKVKEFLVKPREEAVTNLVNEKFKRMQDLKANVIDRLGIHQKSAESAAVQKFGEGRLSLQELQQQFPNKWQNVVEAEKYFRSQYDELIERLNEVQVRNGYKPTPRREDYFTHFKEAANIFEQVMQKERGLDTALAGVSDYTQPGRPFNPFRMKRKGGEFTDDAVQGYARYVNPVLSEIHLTDSVARARTFKRALAETTKESRNVNNFLIALQDSADQLALKRNRFDALIQDRFLGNGVTKSINWLRSRLGKNSILYNLSSAVSNTLPMQQLVTELGPAKVLKAMYSVALDSAKDDFALNSSKFLQRRYRDIGIRDIDPRGLQKAEQAGAWLFQRVDEFTGKTVWTGLYDQAIKKGLTSEQAIRLADEQANKLLAGRSIGELPTAFTSDIFKIGLQFQTEVNNYINYAFRDIGIKDSVKLAKLFVYANLTNNVFEVMMNRRPLLDPIDAAIDAFQEGDLVKGAGRMTGEALSNMPGGQLLANIYPIYGMKILGMKLPTREKFFGRSEAGRFGPIPLSGVTNNPMTSVVTPFGGSQLRKTYTGAKAIAEGGVYQEARSKNVFAQKKKRFGINNPLETAKALTFGPYATSAAKEYFEKPKIRKRTF